MTRPSELFAISAAVLLVLSFLSRVQASQVSISITVGNTAYAFAPSAIFLWMASLLCFSAAIYAIWPLPMNVKAGVWHYGITALAIAAFWGCFYLFAFRFASPPYQTPYKIAVLLGQTVFMVVILLAQTIFFANLIVAIVRLRSFSTRP